jgi:hypothetical protein
MANHYFPSESFRTLCAGVFFVKNTKTGVDFLKSCLQTFIERKRCRSFSGRLRLSGRWAGECYEQGIMNELLKRPPYEEVFELIPSNHVVHMSSIYYMDIPCLILHLFLNKEVAITIFRRELKRQGLLKA